MPKNKLVLTIVVLSILIIPLIIYLSNLKIMMFDEEFHIEEIKKTGSYERFNNTVGIHHELINYYRFNNKQELVDIDIYTEKEKQHLLDVKNLFKTGILILNISIITLIILIAALVYFDKNYRKNIMSACMLGSFLSIFYMIPIVLAAKLQFNFFFDRFHKIFFEGNYMFSQDSNLIRMYSQEFFSDITLRLFTNIGMTAILIIFISYSVYLFKTKKYLNKNN